MKTFITRLFWIGVLLNIHLCIMPATGQTANCTSHTFPSGNQSVTFNVQNTNSFPIQVTEIKTTTQGGIGNSGDIFTLLYNTAPVNSNGSTWTQGTIGPGLNGWVQAGSSIAQLNSHNEPQTVLSGLNVVIPPNTTYGFALGVIYNTVGYQNLGAGVNSFANGGVILKTGDNISWGGDPFPSTPLFYPRGWSGCIGWSIPLEINLGEISVLNIGEANRIEWNTLSEHDGDYFELERGDDGISFRKLATVDARGNASGYTYDDHRPLSGANYYRLKLVDKTGKFSYSKIVSITAKGSDDLLVEAYPNPFSNMLRVQVYGSLNASNEIITITDVTGKVVLTQQIETGKAEISTSNLVQGFYFIRYSDGRLSQTIMINKH